MPDALHGSSFFRHVSFRSMWFGAFWGHSLQSALCWEKAVVRSGLGNRKPSSGFCHPHYSPKLSHLLWPPRYADYKNPKWLPPLPPVMTPPAAVELCRLHINLFLVGFLQQQLLSFFSVPTATWLTRCTVFEYQPLSVATGCTIKLRATEDLRQCLSSQSLHSDQKVGREDAPQYYIVLEWPELLVFLLWCILLCQSSGEYVI